MHELRHMGVVAMDPRMFDVVEDHAPNARGAVGGVDQIVGHLGGNDLGYMLMLGDRVDLGLGQRTQRDAVLDGQDAAAQWLIRTGSVPAPSTPRVAPPRIISRSRLWP